MKRDALIFRSAVIPWFPPVPRILTPACRSQIRLSIVQPVMIDMVAHLIVRYFGDFPVHPYYLWFSVFARVNHPGCVKRALAFQS